MKTAVAARTETYIARPLIALVPLIQDELSAGDRAGFEHYRRAGEMLLEAREQVAPFKWGQWLSKHFALSRRTAYDYMNLADRVRQDPDLVQHAARSIRSITQPNARRAREVWRPMIGAAFDPRQVRDAEVQLHRDLAIELVDIGYRALAMRLHPDHGGSLDAMRRLNRVRLEFKGVATHTRFGC